MNLIFGRYKFGRYIWAGNAGTSGSGPGPTPGGDDTYIPGLVQVIFFNRDGTKTAIFSNDTEELPFKELTFELTENGCGDGKLVFNTFPAFTEIQYNQRIDVYLFGSRDPWWSGTVLTRPDSGGTASKFEITCYGLYERLDKVQLFGKEYKNMEVADIVRDIAREVESKTGIVFNASKIYNVGYNVTHIKFDGVSAKEALDQLSEFALDFVYGVDSYREFYFKAINSEINEEARIWVGVHCNKFEPSQSIDKIINYAKVKGGAIDDSGESWLAEVQDTESQELYGLSETVLTLPSAYDAADAERWGQYEIDKNKDPKLSAKLGGLILAYPKPDGVFSVRRLTTEGQAAITDLDGTMRTYPITKIKYTVNGDKGIQCDLELGEQPDPPISNYLLALHRNAKNNEALQQAANEQLKGG